MFRFLTFILLIANCLSLAAQEAVNDEIDALVVTANRVPVALKDVASYTRVINRRNIENLGVSTLQELLERELPGIQFRNHGNQVVIDYQGMGSNSVLFLIDGERISVGEQMNVDYLRYPPQDIERIEVIKGAASALYGSNAMSAVINIITRSASKPFALNASAKYDTNGENLQFLSVTSKVGKLSSVTSLNRQKTGGYIVPFRKSGDEKLDTNYNYGIHQKFKYEYSRKLNFVLDGNAFYRERLLHDDILGNSFNGYRGNFITNYAFNDKTALKFSYLIDYYSKYNFNKQSRNKGLDSDNLQTTANLLLSHKLGNGNFFVGGVEFMGERLFHHTQLRKRYTDYNFAAFAQHNAMFFDDKLVLEYGVRADIHSGYTPKLSPKLSLMYKLGHFQFRSSVAGGLNIPNLKQRYMDFEHTGGGFAVFKIAGNPDLKPQTSTSFNTSAEYTGKNFRASLMAYHISFDNRLVETWVPGKGIFWDNKAGASSVSGLEYIMRFTLPYNFFVRTGYSFTYEHNYSVKKGGTRINNSQTRPHMGILGLDYHKRFRDFSFFATINGRIASTAHYPDIDSATNEVVYMKNEGFSIFDCMARVEYKSFAGLSFHVNNLTNHIPDVISFDSPLTIGRSYAATLYFRF